MQVFDEPIDGPRAAALVDALLAEFLELYGPGTTEPYPAEVFAAPDGAFVVGLDNGTPVACGGLIRFDATTAELKRMYVAKGVRGRGLSRTLLTAIEERARALGYIRIVLETGTRQAAAVRLYESAGYGHIPCYPPYEDRAISICMARTLTPAPAA